MIISALYAKQKQRGGFLTNADLTAIADDLAVPLHRIQSLVSFFPHFRLQPPCPVEVKVCRDMACHLRGGVQTAETLQAWAKQQHAGQVEVCSVSCLGRCDRPVATFVNEQLYVSRSPAELQAVVESHLAGAPVAADSDGSRATAVADRWEMDVYQGPSNYAGVKSFVEHQRADTVLEALETAGLLGMGGAGGRTYLKWSDVKRARGSDKFVVCNADESEPGTFKDREILLAAPHLTIEGMILAALVVGASRGWIYVRHEYSEQVARLEDELQRTRELGVLGRNILGSGKNFELEVFVSPGGYICGEQTALIEVLEDKRAEPRNRPPELMTNGYQNQPTLLNNVETFAWVPAIVLRSAGTWFADQGRRDSPWVGEVAGSIRGRRLFSISGDVTRPGVYEVPTGIPLGELIERHAGGMLDGKALVAVALSGPSGGLLPASIPVASLNRRFVESCVPAGVTTFDIRELPLDINVSRSIGLMIGAGIVVYGSGTDVLSEALACSRFFRNESCGKCVPCRLGSEKMTQMGERLLAGSVHSRELPVLQATALELAGVMSATSICGLGQVASNPLRSIFTYFPDLAVRACLDHRPAETSDRQQR